MAVEIVKSGSALGAEIVGVDLTKPLDDETFAAVRNAFYDHEVAFFRGRPISDEDHIRFTARFGELRKLRFGEFLHDRHPEIFVVSNVVENGKHIGAYDAGVFWHTDGSYLKNPHAISALRALEVPEKDGRACGDTEFASTRAAYDALSETMKKRLENLEAVQSVLLRYKKSADAGIKSYALNDQVKSEAETAHPVVRVHPVTGRKCLYVSEGYTVRILGLPEDESRDLVRELTAHCVKPEFRYRHSWQVHDLVMWDDCSTLHKATFDYALPQRRLMHRTTVISGTDGLAA